MHRVRPPVILLTLAIMLTLFPATYLPADAAAPVAYRGVIRYRMRGPAAAPYGVGSALLVGAAAPVAIARIQNILRNVVELVGRLPAAQDEPTMETVRKWMDEGIPIDLAQELPVAGAYEATITFALAEESDGILQLQSGKVRWRTSNSLHLSDGDVSLDDDFTGSGVYTLDPATDRISLRIDPKTNPPMGELEVEINHPEPLDGRSEFSGPEGTFLITLEASGGEMVLDGAAMGVPISAVGFPTPMTIIEAPGFERTISYQRRAPLDEMDYHVEIWKDAFDNQVMVEYDLSASCESRIVAPELDAVLAYDDSDAGVLEFTVEAKAEPWSLGALLDDLVWTLPDIPGSVLTTDPQDRRGREVTVRYENLPARNNDFGEQTIEARLESSSECGDPPPLGVRIFFSRDAMNNSSGEEPNWFTFWKQTRAGQGHGGAIVYDGTEMDGLGYFNGYVRAEEAGHIYITSLIPGHTDVNPVTGKATEGIDVFASVVLHEWTHLENYHDWWPQGYKAAEDSDDDLVPDDREAAYGLDPLNRDTFGLGLRDSEIPAYLQAHTWPSGSANDVDWANPGKQSGGGD